MGEHGLWFKLWCDAPEDADLDNLDISDFGRWCKLGAYIKAHGEAGTIKISAPARSICAMFQVATFELFQCAVSRLPNVQMRRENSPVSSETVITVTFLNWLKYQGDYSTARVRKFRSMKRLRGEERRVEENKRRGDSVTRAVSRTKLPSNFEPSPAIISLAQKNGWPDPEKELEAFRDHHKSKGTLSADWDASFRSWLRKALQFEKPRRKKGASEDELRAHWENLKREKEKEKA